MREFCRPLHQTGRLHLSSCPCLGSGERALGVGQLHPAGDLGYTINEGALKPLRTTLPSHSPSSSKLLESPPHCARKIFQTASQCRQDSSQYPSQSCRHAAPVRSYQPGRTEELSQSQNSDRGESAVSNLPR
eukprot:355515-Chlamydomonas_euryale.AAC.21